jgi:hypothetical protein
LVAILPKIEQWLAKPFEVSHHVARDSA